MKKHPEIIQRGAEAIIYLEKGKLVKERIAKGYRIPELDHKIRKQRTKSEAKLMKRSEGAGAFVPNVQVEDDFRLVMEYLRGEKLKDVLNSMPTKKRNSVCEKIGGMIAKLHTNGIIHGDLTTSNMILSNGDVFFIDFGLGKFSEKIEDQAVDLFLLYEALKSTHFKVLEECWGRVLKTYERDYSRAEDVSKRIEKIKKRRRYRGD